VTPAAVAGPCTGGQLTAHDPVHLDVVDVSGANEYSVKPLLLVSTVTPAIVAVFTVSAAAGAELLLPEAEDEGEDEGVGDAPAELHATRAVAAAAAAGRARSIRRRARLLLVRRTLPLPPRLRIFRGVMTFCPLYRVSVPAERRGRRR